MNLKFIFSVQTSFMFHFKAIWLVWSGNKITFIFSNTDLQRKLREIVNSWNSKAIISFQLSLGWSKHPSSLAHMTAERIWYISSFAHTHSEVKAKPTQEVWSQVWGSAPLFLPSLHLPIHRKEWALRGRAEKDPDLEASDVAGCCPSMSEKRNDFKLPNSSLLVLSPSDMQSVF